MALLHLALFCDHRLPLDVLSLGNRCWHNPGARVTACPRCMTQLALLTRQAGVVARPTCFCDGAMHGSCSPPNSGVEAFMPNELPMLAFKPPAHCALCRGVCPRWIYNPRKPHVVKKSAKVGTNCLHLIFVCLVMLSYMLLPSYLGEPSG